jgi:hypothetical protein
MFYGVSEIKLNYFLVENAEKTFIFMHKILKGNHYVTLEKFLSSFNWVVYERCRKFELCEQLKSESSIASHTVLLVLRPSVHGLLCVTVKVHQFIASKYDNFTGGPAIFSNF